jgi:cathepsin D
MAFPAISKLGRNPFFIRALDEGRIHTDTFGFKLAKIGSLLYLGGTDRSSYTGSIEYHPLSSSSGFWQIGDATAHVNGAALSGFQTIIDTGTTIMYGPPDAVQEFYSHVPGATLYNSDSGLYSFPCDHVPTVAFSWGGKSWSVSAEK